VNLSAHPAPIIQPQAKSPFASGQKAADRVVRPYPASIQPSFDGDSAFCISNGFAFSKDSSHFDG
jgi:hypothetical protein